MFFFACSLASRPAFEPPAEHRIGLTPNLSPAKRQVAETWNRIGGALQTCADQLSIDPSHAIAVWVVETDGQAFGPDGRMTVRFENHIFLTRGARSIPTLSFGTLPSISLTTSLGKEVPPILLAVRHSTTPIIRSMSN
jgi:hypothetical protein